MKKILVLLVLISLAATVLAESVKFAYIDTDRVMIESKLTQEAQTILMNERQNWEQELGDMETEIKDLKADYRTKEMILTESGKKEANDKIKEKESAFNSRLEEIFGEEGKLVQKQYELMEPILNKLKTVIDKIAVENNYSMIFDAASGGLLYAKPSMDITELVLEELDKAPEEETQE